MSCSGGGLSGLYLSAQQAGNAEIHPDAATKNTACTVTVTPFNVSGKNRLHDALRQYSHAATSSARQ